MPKAQKFFFENYFKGFTQINGKVVEDVELHRTRDNRKETVTGHRGNIPIRFTRVFQKKRKNVTSKKKRNKN